jgi:hypothetical protein
MGEVEVYFYIILTFSLYGAQRLTSLIDSLIPKKTAPGVHRLGDCVDGLNVLDRERHFPPNKNKSVLLGLQLLDYLLPRLSYPSS